MSSSVINDLRLLEMDMGSLECWEFGCKELRQIKPRSRFGAWLLRLLGLKGWECYFCRNKTITGDKGRE
jgi:hypothetical protein